MLALKKARSSNADSFEYKGKKYSKKKTKTGLIIYSLKKGGGKHGCMCS